MEPMFPYLGTILVSCLLATVESTPPNVNAEPVRMATTAFGVSAEIEVRNLHVDAAQKAIEEALAEIFMLSRLSDPDGEEPGGMGALNRAAAQGPQAVEPRLAELLLRSLQFCIWSNGSYGPLGGDLNEMWESLRAKNERPSPSDLRRAVGSAECSRLSLANQEIEGIRKPTAELKEGSRIDLRGISRGFAIDRAAEILKRHDATNFWIEIGNVWSAHGDGPEGRGWLAVLPPAPGEKEPMDQIWLRDQTLAMHSAEPLMGEIRDPIDQRSGVPSRGVVTVVTVAELASDAEPLAIALFILGHREGHMKLGSLRPRPSVFWLLGHGTGTPLESTYHWSDLDRVWRR